jgi:Ribonuclease G/E
VLDFVSKFQPALVNRVKLHLKDTPIFEEYGLNTEIEKALRPKVWLKSGGYIVINQTEALVAIDVNTGKFVGKSNRSKTRLCAPTSMPFTKSYGRFDCETSAASSSWISSTWKKRRIGSA